MLAQSQQPQAGLATIPESGAINYRLSWKYAYRSKLGLIDGLLNPDQPAEQLLHTLTFRRADGREISLQEFPLAQALSTGETVRAEEIVVRLESPVYPLVLEP